MYHWPNYSFDGSQSYTFGAIQASNSIIIGNAVIDDCGHDEGQTLVKHFSIEEGHKTQAEIEALVVNNAELSVDCSYYKSAFEFVAGDPSD